jgi:hypothetical protein
VLGLALALVGPFGCDDSDATGCAACDGEIEYCVFFGSDVSGEPGSYDCKPLPAACGEAPVCDCLEGAEASDFNLSFCLEEGGCEETSRGLKVTCPGG